ncbi:hypothetical protein FOZ63_013409 [Perkinsus olseni]|uniref:Uncharacterized protein n=3 Tax=Perkinsus olseni TaxID=32597 RepID=A0A7J6QEV6_PEROL|nr:hypothetical protein FOZ63_013409 [Perkinsus olseni]
MRVYLVVIGSTLTWLANAEYKYYCKFFEELLAQCIGRPIGGPVTTLSQHGALTHPDRPNEVRYVSEVCRVKDRPTGSAEGSLKVHPRVKCDIEIGVGVRLHETSISYEREKRIFDIPSYYFLTNQITGMSYQFAKLRPIAPEDVVLRRSQSIGTTAATFVSHAPRYWRAILTEEVSHSQDAPPGCFKLPGRADRDRPRYVIRRQRRPKFQVRMDNGTSKNLTALDTFDEMMRLETSSDQYDDDTSIRAEAFIFEYSWLGESHKAIMVTFKGESAILFDTSMRPLRSAEYKYFSSVRYPNRYREAQR